MKITWITYDFGEYSVRHVSAMSPDHQVQLLLPRTELEQHGELLDSRVRTCSFEKPRLRQPWRQLRLNRRLLRSVAEFQPDVIHFQQGHLWFNFCLPRLKRLAPLVITIHDPKHHAGDAVSAKTPQWVIDYGFRQADHAIVHGQQLVPDVVQRHGLPADRIHVIPHIAMGNRRDDDIVVDTQTTHDILFFGRIWEYKGLEYLIRAEAILAQRLSDYRIVIAGEGEDFSKYRAMIQGRDRFLVHNAWVDDDLRARFFRDATIVVLPYIEATQSGVIPVAYAFRKPVVATRVGALPECVEDGITGILVPPRDEVALADAMIQLLTDLPRARRMGEAGYQRLIRESSAEVVAAQTIEVYEAALRPKRRSQTAQT